MNEKKEQQPVELTEEQNKDVTGGFTPIAFGSKPSVLSGLDEHDEQILNALRPKSESTSL